MQTAIRLALEIVFLLSGVLLAEHYSQGKIRGAITTLSTVLLIIIGWLELYDLLDHWSHRVARVFVVCYPIVAVGVAIASYNTKLDDTVRRYCASAYLFFLDRHHASFDAILRLIRRPQFSRKFTAIAVALCVAAVLFCVTWWVLGNSAPPPPDQISPKPQTPQAQSVPNPPKTVADDPAVGSQEPNLEVGTEKPKGAEIKASSDAVPRAGRAFQPAHVLSLTEESALTQGDQFKECENCPQMIVVPSGSFTMGSPPSEVGRDESEEPLHLVIFPQPFAVGRFAVSVSEWKACVADSGCIRQNETRRSQGRDQDPIVNVSWNDAQMYVAWLSLKTGKNYRLLSEAEREYVTRAGSATPLWWGSTITTDQANYDGKHSYAEGARGEFRNQVVAVDSFLPNPWGLFQVHGNVWEWVQDCYRSTYSEPLQDGLPWFDDKCDLRVTRGGSWRSPPKDLRAASRGRMAAFWSTPNTGLRVARTLQALPKQTSSNPCMVRYPTEISLQDPSSATATTCDRLGLRILYPYLPQGVDGRHINAIDPRTVIRVCEPLIAQAPYIARFHVAMSLASTVLKDRCGAAQYMSNAARLGDKFAVGELGTYYFNGDVIERDYRKAFELFSKSAEANDLQGTANLGVMYLNGFGVVADPVRGCNLFLKAAQAGLAKAMRQFATCLDQGNGAPKDKRAAAEWWLRGVLSDTNEALDSPDPRDAVMSQASGLLYFSEEMIVELQKFLKSKGYFGGDATKYNRAATVNAVTRYFDSTARTPRKPSTTP
jgi:formylglycine-generating enzyme required for sulfatase activity